jgi:glutathione S-transferase
MGSLYYYPLAGRCEALRMTAKLGGCEIEDIMTDGKDIDLKSFGSPGSLPVFQHGDMKISQSDAICTYIYNETKFSQMTPAQKAKDRQFMGIMMDIMDGCMPKVFADAKEKKDMKDAKANALKVQEKFYDILEVLAPAEGFVNGLEYPTMADFCLVVLYKGITPYVNLGKFSNFDPWTRPKIKAIVDKTLAVPEVADYVKKSASMMGNPFADVFGLQAFVM